MSPGRLGSQSGFVDAVDESRGLDGRGEILLDADKHGTPAVAKPTAKLITFDDFLDDHLEPWALVELKSGKAYIANLRAQFREPYGKKPLTFITHWNFEKFKTRRLKAGISPVTVNRDHDRLRAALNKAVEWKLLDSNPLAGVKRSKIDDDPRVRFLNAAEEQRLRAALRCSSAKRSVVVSA